MNAYVENILLLDHQPRAASNCAQVLELLGYRHFMYRDYSRPQAVEWADDDVDAVVAAWTAPEIERRELLLALMGCSKLPRVRGVLVVSPFSTPANARLLQLSGARAWIRYPFSMNEFDSRLRYLLNGERRRTRQSVRYDRRREPAFPVAAVWSNGHLALPGTMD
jgi:DNA-binding response OmpR family regulator